MPIRGEPHHGSHKKSNKIVTFANWYEEADGARSAVHNAKLYSRSHHAVTRVYDADGNVIETHEHAGEFREP